MRANLLLMISALLFALTAGCSEKPAEKESSQADEAASSAENAENKTATADETAAASAASCTMEMNVTGMACGVGCPPVVKKALMTVEGVKNVDVSFEKSLATIEASGKACEDGAHKALIQVLKDKDYIGTLKVAEPEGVKAEKDPT